MKTIKMAAVAAALAFSLPAVVQAETMDDMRFGDIVSVKMMDKNKDGKVTRAEFIEMMGKVWDMKARKMGVKGTAMTSIEFDEVAKYLRAGG